MSQHDFNIANAPGATVRADINGALAALATCSSGTTEPASPYAYQLWADVTNDRLKQRNAANSGWNTILILSTGLPFASATQNEMLDGTVSDLRCMTPKLVMQAITSVFATATIPPNLNLSTIAADWTIPVGYNASSAGPITIGENITVSVSNNSNWSIL